MKSLITANPLIQRYRFSLMRPRQFGVYLAIYLIIGFLLLLINAAARTSVNIIFAEILVFQVVLLWMWAANNSGTAIRDEVMEKTYDFFRMLPLTAHQKAVGILLGKNLTAMLFSAINFVFLIFLGLAATSVIQLIQIILLLFCGAFCINSVALLFSIRTEFRLQKTSSSGALILLLLFVVPMVFSAIGELYESDWGRNLSIPFYTLKIPVFLFFALLALYKGVWAYIGVIRKFIEENQCLFTRIGAILFMLGCEVILLGLYLPHFHGKERFSLAYGFWGTSLLPLLFISLGSVRSFNAYWFHSGTLLRLSRNAFMGRMFVFSNTGLAVLLFAIWAVFAVFAAVKVELNMFHSAQILVLLSLSYLFLVLLMEIWALYRPDSEKIGLLLVVIAGVYVVLPLICASLFGTEGLITASPIGLFITLCEEVTLPTSWLIALLIYHAVICLIPAIIVIQQWDRIRETRNYLAQPK